jgi:DeoR/GlpR family transcriptional regulator of sugar metabolism
MPVGNIRRRPVPHKCFALKVPQHVVEERRAKLEQLVSSSRYVPIREVCEKLGISEATARRDLRKLEHAGRIQRTRGGALSEFDERFPSYHERQRKASRSKTALARAALKAIRPGLTLFFDSGTTVSYLAKALAEAPRGPLRILTVSLPVAEVLAPHREIEVFLTGGQMLPRQSVLLGEAVVRTIEAWRFDVAFLSAEGMDSEGLWNSQLAIVAHQHAVIRRTDHNVFLLDRSKLGRGAAHFLLPWPAVDHLLTDANAARIKALSPTAGRVAWFPSMPAPEFVKPTQPAELPVHYL